MEFIIMTLIGVISLAGTVVDNAIVLIDYTTLVRKRSIEELGLNIDFINFVSTFDPKFCVGGDSVVFQGPMSWPVMFGLTFATFLTSVIASIIYLMLNGSKCKMKKMEPVALQLSRADHWTFRTLNPWNRRNHHRHYD